MMYNAKSIVNNPLNVLMIMLSAIRVALLFIRFLGFNIAFVPLADIFICIALSAIILTLTTFIMRTNLESAKTSSIAYGFLPGLSIVFILLINNAINTYAFIVLFLVTLVCCLILFFAKTKPLQAKILLGIAYIFVTISIALVLLLTTILPPFGHNEVIQSTFSPNGHFKAELWENCQGALGGATWIDVTRQPDSINFFFAKLQRRPTRVYSGRWGEFDRMTLYWEADDLLRVDFDTPLTFRFNGQRWVRE